MLKLFAFSLEYALLIAKMAMTNISKIDQVLFKIMKKCDAVEGLKESHKWASMRDCLNSY